MSMPKIEKSDNPIDREQSVNNLIESIALMETGLSHIINAEGEKIQKVIKHDQDVDVPIEDILKVNDSVGQMVNSISKLEMMLQNKLDISKELDEPSGIPGPKGDKGDPGEDGLTPHIGPNGHWWIGDTDTGTPAQGPSGATTTNIGLSAENDIGTLIINPGGMPISLPIIQYTNGFTANNDYTSFTIEEAGTYFITYCSFINIIEVFTLGLSVNDLILDETVISSIAPENCLANSVVLHFDEGDTLQLILNSNTTASISVLGTVFSLVMFKIA